MATGHPIEELGEAVNLIVVLPIGEREHLCLELIKPRGALRNMDVPRLDQGHLIIETSDLVRLWIYADEVLEVFATKCRDRKAAHAFLKRAMKRYGRPKVIVTDRLRSYRAAMKTIGIAKRQECGRWLNNRAENSHQPFR